MELEHAVQRLLKRLEEKSSSHDEVRNALVKLRAVEDVAELVKGAGRPECEQGRKFIEKACYDLLRQGQSPSMVQTIVRLLAGLWTWLDAEALTSGHQALLELVHQKQTSPAKQQLIVTNAYQALDAVYTSLEEVVAGGGGSAAWKFLDALSATCPSLEKLDPPAKVAGISAVSRCMFVCVTGVGPPAHPLKEDHKGLKWLLKATKDKDAWVRVAAFRGLPAAGKCCAVSGGAPFSALLAAAAKGVEDKVLRVQNAAASAFGELLHISFEQQNQAAAATAGTASAGPLGGLSPVMNRFGLRRKKDVDTLSNALQALKQAFNSAPAGAAACGVREAVAFAAVAFFKCAGTATSGAPRELLKQVLAFLTRDSVAPGKGQQEHEVLHSARCAAYMLSHWSMACGTEPSRIAVVKECLSVIQAKAADRDKLDPNSFACLYLLPDLIVQLGEDAATAVYDETLRCMSTATAFMMPMRQRLETAKVLHALAVVTRREESTVDRLVAHLINLFGNAACGEGTPCDHESMRQLTAAGFAVLSLLPFDPCERNNSVRERLAVLCSVWTPTPPFHADVKPSGKSGASKTPLDPQHKLEQACLLEACHACSGGFASLPELFPALVLKLAPVLAGGTPPTQPKEIYNFYRAKGSALISIAAVLRFAKASGDDLAPVCQNLDEIFLAGLEDTFESLYHKGVATWSSEECNDMLLCKVRTAAYEVVALLPQLQKSSALYSSVFKRGVQTLNAMCAVHTPCTCLPSLLGDALPPYFYEEKGILDASVQPRELEVETTIPSEVTAWHRLVTVSSDVCDGRGSGVLVWERTAVSWRSDLLNECVRCVGILFARQGKGNKRNLMQLLRNAAAGAVEKQQKGKAADRVTLLNTTAAALAALSEASVHRACRESLWAQDPDLLQAVRDAIVLAKYAFPSPCPLTRAAAAEVVGLATALAGSLTGSDSFEFYLPAVLSKTQGVAASSLAMALAALHEHDPHGRADVLGLSLSYLQKLQRCANDESAKKGDEAFDPNGPFIVASLGRIVHSAGKHIELYADSAAIAAAERVLVPAASFFESGNGADADAASLAATMRALHAYMDCLDPSNAADHSSPMLLIVSDLLRIGAVHRDTNTRCEAYHALSHAFSHNLGGLLPCLSETGSFLPSILRDLVTDLTVGQDACLITAACTAVRCICRSRPVEASDTLSPTLIVKLIEAACPMIGSDCALVICEAAKQIVKHASSLLQSDASALGKRRLVEWIDVCTERVASRRIVVEEPVEGNAPDDEEADGDESPSQGRSDREKPLATAAKAWVFELIRHALEAVENDRPKADDRRWLAPSVEALMRASLLAAGDQGAPHLRTVALRTLGATVELLADVPDSLSGASVISPYQTQLIAATRQAFEPPTTDSVVSAAASLAAKLIIHGVVSPQSIPRLTTLLASHYDASESQATTSIGVTSAGSRLICWALESQATISKDPALPNSNELPHDVVLASLPMDKVQASAASCLRNLIVLSGTLAGWVTAEPNAPVPPLSSYDELQAESVPLLSIVALDASEGALVSGAAIQLLSSGHADVGGIVKAIEPRLQATASLEHSASLIAVLRNAAEAVEGDELATIVRGLLALHGSMKGLDASDDVPQLAAYLAVKLLVGSHAVFSGLCDDQVCSQQPDDFSSPSQAVAGITCLRLLAADERSGMEYAALLLDAIVRATSVDDESMADACRTAIIALLQVAAKDSDASDELTLPLRSFVRAVLQQPASTARWALLALAVSWLSTVDARLPEVGDVDDAICRTVSQAAEGAVGAAPQCMGGFLAALAKARESASALPDAFVENLSMLSLAAGSSVVSAPVKEETAAGLAPAMSGAKLVIACLFVLQVAYQSEPARLTPVLAAAVASISAGISSSQALSVPLGRCLMEIASRFHAHFKQLLPQLPPARVSVLRAQMSAAQPGAATQPAAPPPRQPASPAKLSINASAYAG